MANTIAEEMKEETPVFKEFIKKYVATQGVTVPDKAVSLRMAKMVASIMEFVWRTFRLNGHPPLYKGFVNILGMEFITTDKRAKQEFNYKPIVTIGQGFALMRK